MALRFKLLILCPILVLHLFAQTNAPRPKSGVSAQDLLQAVVNNELRISSQDHSHWKYISKSQTSDKTLTKMTIETNQGDIQELIAVNNQPLTADKKNSEAQRIRKLTEDRQKQKSLRHDQEEDAQKTRHLLGVLPRAFTFTYGEKKGDQVELNFVPNPSFHPSSHEEQVLHSMDGAVWVDTQKKRLCQIQGHLTRTVKFGGGLLGHLDKGGQFIFKQQEVAPNHWEMVFLHVDMHGKAIFFKNISVQEDECRNRFQREPDDLTMAQAAAEMIKSTANLSR